MSGMKARVYPLRERGRRTRRSESHEGIAGELQLTSTMHGTEAHTALRLCAREALTIHDKDLLPPLYSPKLVALGSDSLLLRGFQSDDGTAYVQEWRCVLAARSGS
jgi:hypothetical protein